MSEKNMATKADTDTTVVAEDQPEVRVGYSRWDSFTASLMEWVQDADMYLPKFKVVPVNNGTNLYKPPWVWGVFSDISGCVVVGSGVGALSKQSSWVWWWQQISRMSIPREAMCHENPWGRKMRCRMCLVFNAQLSSKLASLPAGLAMKDGDRDRKGKHRKRKLWVYVCVWGGSTNVENLPRMMERTRYCLFNERIKTSKRIKREYARRHGKSTHVHMAKMGAGDLNGVQSTAVWRKCFRKSLEMIGTGRKLCYETLQHHLSGSLLITIVGRKKIYKEETFSCERKGRVPRLPVLH